jgi:hypothetical protein
LPRVHRFVTVPSHPRATLWAKKKEREKRMRTMRNTKEQLALEMLRRGEQVDVGGIPMVVTYVGQHGGEAVALATEDGLGVEWDLSCPGEDLGSDDEVLCADLLSGEHYRVCVYCRGVTTARLRAATRN